MTLVTSWTDEIDATLDRLRLQVDLRVLVWGPGEVSRQLWFGKRTEVIEALKTASQGRDKVFTSEELSRLHSTPPIEDGSAELIHAETADVIIALVMASPSRQGGVYRELQIIAPHEDLRRKVWIFLPTDKRWMECFQAGVLKLYREHQKIQLGWRTLMACDRLRDMCINKVDEERKQRMYNVTYARSAAKGQRL